MDFRSERIKNLLKVWHYAISGAREYVLEKDFVQIHGMPELVGITGACENVDTLFKLDFFGRQAYLAQSGQLYLEMLTPKMDKCWAEIQSFRAEPEADPRHLAQFSLFEIEHKGDLNELLDNIEGIVFAMASSVIKNCQKELAYFGRDHKELFSEIASLHRITYTDAVEALKPHFPELQWGDDLKAHHEAKLTEMFGAMFVTHYPLEIKFFNMMQNADDPRVVNSADLLLPYSGESAGSAEREHEHDRIAKRLKESEMYKRLIALGGKDEDFAWYLDAHKGQDIPLHSGAGLGVNRIMQFILGQDDIRDVTPFLVNCNNLL